MKRKFRIFTAVIMAIVMLVSLASCDNGGEPSSSEGISGNQDDPNLVNVTIWCASVYADFFNDFVEAFEQQNDEIKLKVVVKPETDLYGSLDSTLGTNTAPDIFTTLGGMITPILYRSGHLLDVDDIVLAAEADLIENAKLNKKDADGKYHSIPLTGFASPVIFYNADQFEQMKQSDQLSQQQKDAVKEPETYGELVALCEAIRAFGMEPLTGAFNSWHMPHFMQAMHARTMSTEAFNSLMYTGGENPFKANLQAYAQGFDLLKKYYDDGIFEKDFLARNLSDADMQFKQNRALLRMGVSLDYNDLREQMPFEVNSFYLPPSDTVTDTPRANVIFADVVCGNSHTENPDEVKTVLEYMLTPEAQSILARYSMMPSVKTADVSEMSSVIKDMYDEIINNGANDFYQSWSFSGLDIELLIGAHAVIAGSMTSEQAANKVSDFYDSVNQ